jgi:hypothetical protein
MVAIEGNSTAVARMLNMSARTLQQWQGESKEFADVRAEIERAYIIDAWSNISKGSELMMEKLNNTEFTDKMSIRALSEVLVNLHNTVSNVATHMMAIQVNVNLEKDQPEAIEQAATQFLADKYGLTVEEVTKRLTC